MYMNGIDWKPIKNDLTGVGQESNRQLVVNWHLTETCNYACDFCYAKWVKPRERELIHDSARMQNLLAQLFEFFRPSRDANSIGDVTPWDSVRLNVAGGEPLLYRKETLAVVNFARDLGFDVSMITNGSLLDRTLLEELAPKMSLLGISVDSGQAAVNRGIGRADKRTGQPLALDAVAASLRNAREFNPQLRLKINTVVNALNWQEDMTPVIRRLAPGKWKVLQMLPVQNSNLAVSAAQFDEFVKRHESLDDIMSVEDNDSMTESYIMIDPLGRFYQNTTEGQGQYRYSRPILQAGAREAFAELPWSESKFLSRYAQSLMGTQSIRQDTKPSADLARYPVVLLREAVTC
jgi:radical S-adenosyl methionine domain-containing protein 2